MSKAKKSRPSVPRPGGRFRKPSLDDRRYVRIRMDVGLVVENGEMRLSDWDDRHAWRDAIMHCLSGLVRAASRNQGEPVRVTMRPTEYHVQLLPLPKGYVRCTDEVPPNDEDEGGPVDPTAPLPNTRKLRPGEALLANGKVVRGIRPARAGMRGKR